MSLPLKHTVVQALAAAVRLARPLGKAARLWAFAKLQAAIPHRLPASTVVLGAPEVHGTGDIRLGESLYLYPGLYLETQHRGSIAIGDRVVISRGAHIVAFDRIEIGAGTMIGEYASIRDANHVYAGGEELRDAGHRSRPVIIGRSVWVGRGAAVLAGVTVGDRAVIGANAVVTRDVAAGEVVVGAPARPVGTRRAA